MDTDTLITPPTRIVPAHEHFFGTHIYRATQDIRLTQDLLGHASPTTTAGYAAWSHDGPTVETLPVAS